MTHDRPHRDVATILDLASTRRRYEKACWTLIFNHC
jgi:hypothetical protein